MSEVSQNPDDVRILDMQNRLTERQKRLAESSVQHGLYPKILETYKIIIDTFIDENKENIVIQNLSKFNTEEITNLKKIIKNNINITEYNNSPKFFELTCLTEIYSIFGASIKNIVTFIKADRENNFVEKVKRIYYLCDIFSEIFSFYRVSKRDYGVMNTGDPSDFNTDGNILDFLKRVESNLSDAVLKVIPYFKYAMKLKYLSFMYFYDYKSDPKIKTKWLLPPDERNPIMYILDAFLYKKQTATIRWGSSKGLFGNLMMAKPKIVIRAGDKQMAIISKIQDDESHKLLRDLYEFLRDKIRIPEEPKKAGRRTMRRTKRTRRSATRRTK